MAGLAPAAPEPTAAGILLAAGRGRRGCDGAGAAPDADQRIRQLAAVPDEPAQAAVPGSHRTAYADAARRIRLHDVPA
jgi:hypothetical protein